MTVETLTAMQPAERQQFVGNTIFPRIASMMGGDQMLAGKITGMCLELPVQEQHTLMQSPENLKAAIDQALAVLPPELQGMLPQAPTVVSQGEVRLKAGLRQLQDLPLAQQRRQVQLQVQKTHLPPMAPQ